MEDKKVYLEISDSEETVRITYKYCEINIQEAFDIFERLLKSWGFSEAMINEYKKEYLKNTVIL